MEEKESSISGSLENTDSGSPTPISGGVQVESTQVGSGLGPGLGPGPGSGSGSGSGPAVMMMGGGGGGGKKRGRPRKYDAEGNLNPAYVNAAARRAAQVVAQPPGFTLTMGVDGGSGGGGGGQKRGRGKVASLGNWKQLAPLGELFANTAGGDFTPHVITVQAGEDVAAKILSFSQKGPRGICVLSANGSISNVTIRQPGSSGGLLTYEGRFEILSLTGSYTISEAGGVTSRTGGLSISLAGPDGRVVGGGVAGWLTAASPIQVVVGSFVPGGYNFKVQKRKYHRESSNAAANPAMSVTVTAANPSSQVIPGSETGPPAMSVMMAQSPSEADDSIGSGHNLNVVSSHDTLEWNNGSGPSSDHRIYPDINVSVPGV